VGESLLRQLRKSRGMTQKEVALAIGMPQSTYCLIEHGKRPADWRTVQKICDLFQIEHDDLFVPKRFAVRKNHSCM
jgi:putative transcriptional regulator